MLEFSQKTLLDNVHFTAKQLSHWILRKFITNKLTYSVFAWYHSINIHIHSVQLLTHGITLVTSPHWLGCITELLLRQTALSNSFNGPQNFNSIVSTAVGICNARRALYFIWWNNVATHHCHSLHLNIPNTASMFSEFKLSPRI